MSFFKKSAASQRLASASSTTTPKRKIQPEDEGRSAASSPPKKKVSPTSIVEQSHFDREISDSLKSVSSPTLVGTVVNLNDAKNSVNTVTPEKRKRAASPSCARADENGDQDIDEKSANGNETRTELGQPVDFATPKMAPGQKYAMHAAVYVNFKRRGEWYPAKILKYRRRVNKYDVIYDEDCVVEKRVMASCVLNPTEFASRPDEETSSLEDSDDSVPKIRRSSRQSVRKSTYSDDEAASDDEAEFDCDGKLTEEKSYDEPEDLLHLPTCGVYVFSDEVNKHLICMNLTLHL